MRKYTIVDATNNQIIQYPVNILKLAKEWDLKASEVEQIVTNANNGEITIIKCEDAVGNGVVIPTK